jgi:hypothetical protein
VRPSAPVYSVSNISDIGSVYRKPGIVYGYVRISNPDLYPTGEQQPFRVSLRSTDLTTLITLASLEPQI